MSFNNSANEGNRNESIEINIDNDNDLDNNTYCICKRNCYGKMIACDECYNWFHFGCVGINENEEPENWICNSCKITNSIKNEKKGKTRKT
jgi:hypothetical protein